MVFMKKPTVELIGKHHHANTLVVVAPSFVAPFFLFLV